MSSDYQSLDVEALHGRPSTLTEASKRIDESLDFDTVSQVVVDRGRALTGSPCGVSTTLDDSGLPKGLATSGMAQGTTGPWGTNCRKACWPSGTPEASGSRCGSATTVTTSGRRASPISCTFRSVTTRRHTVARQCGST